MLYSVNSKSKIASIPYAHDFERWKQRLSENEYQAIVTELRSRIAGSEVQTSSWIPGSDWTGSVFQPIYDKACGQDMDASARFFGLIVWDVFMRHEDWWAFGRYEKDGIPIRGLTYFKIDNPL